MNTLTRTITALVALNLLISGLAPAQDVPAGELQDIPATEAKEADVARREAEIAVREAQRQAESALRRREASLRQADVALARRSSMLAPEPPAFTSTGISTISRGRWPSRSGSGAGAILVIPSAQIKTEDIVTINEDMNVMSRILDKQLARSRLARSPGYNPYSSRRPTLGDLPLVGGMFRGLGGQDGHATEVIYLEGFGAIFLMGVDLPLIAPPKADEKKTKESADSVWAETRQEIYMPDAVKKSKQTPPAEQYDAEKVEKLKRTLTDTLKHAANIRALKPDQRVIVTVIGGASQSGTMVTKTYRGKQVLVTDPTGIDVGSMLPTVLTICVKKSDIDSFSKGDLDFDQFQKQTKVFTSYASSERGGLSNAERLYYIAK